MEMKHCEITGAQSETKNRSTSIGMKHNESIRENTQETVRQDGYMLKAEVAALIRKTPRTVEAWMRAGILPYIKIGKGRRATVLFRRADIDARLTANFGVGFSS